MSDDQDKVETGAKAGVGSILDEAKGKAKEAAGAVTGHDDLKDEGQRDQQRADLKEDAAKAEAEAEKKETEAEAKHQKAKAKKEAAESTE